MTTLKRIVTSKKFLLSVAFVIFWTPVIVFLKIAGEIVEKEPIGLDSAILQWIHSYANPFLDQFFLAVTNVGGVIGILGLTAVLTAYFLYKRQRQDALLLAAGVGGAAVANVVLKFLFHRDRPSIWHPSVIETSFSFPSGHAMLSSAFVLSLIVILWPTWLRYYSIIVGIVAVALIGLSRLYLGVHYPTDIVAGWSVSFAWVFIATFIVQKLSHMFRSKMAAHSL